MTQPPIQAITMEQLHKAYKHLKPGELILDVRTAEEYADGHVPGSKNISHELVAEHVSELMNYEHIYVYCRSGRRVQAACCALVEAGVRNISAIISGGMPDWELSGYPVER